jgi:hypothetical protein
MESNPSGEPTGFLDSLEDTATGIVDFFTGGRRAKQYAA